MNRLIEKMAALKQEQGKAFIAYIMAGEPGWEATEDIILHLESIGVTAVELGVPFSDPIADGPVIQEAANRALTGGVNLASIYEHVGRIREKTRIPLLLMGYWNVFFQYGIEEVLTGAKRAGIDGFIVADLPPEAETPFFHGAREAGLCTVLLASELTTEERLRKIAETTTGFLYYVPQLGITGLDLKITDAVKHTTIADLYVETFVLAANLERWNSLDSKLKQVIVETSADMSKKTGQSLDQGSVVDMQWMKEQGQSFYTLSPDESEKWDTALQPIFDEWFGDIAKKGYTNAKQIIEDAKRFKM